jgi:TnpA family transposase
VRTGVVSASLILQRLSAYPRQNGLALALREVGRIQRTLLILDWLDDPLLRRHTTAELNKGEARNGLTRAVSFHRLGRVRDRTTDARQHRVGGLTLATAAIVLWNTVYLDRALDALRRDGIVVPDAFLSHLAPLGWRHINLTGDYHWDGGIALEPDGFRPLRPRPPVLAAA